MQPSGASPLDEAALARITALQRDGSPDLLGHLMTLKRARQVYIRRPEGELVMKRN